MRLAFVDLVFSWPPLGGAPADLYHTAAGLQDLGHNVHLFFTASEENYDRGAIDLSDLPFPATRLEFTPKTYTPEHLPGEVRRAVDAWKPDAVFVCFGFFLKPFVIEALAHYPLLARYYADELACLRDFRWFKDGETCPKNYLVTPDDCRKCTLKHLKPEILTGRPGSYTQEFLMTRAHSPDYYERLVRTVEMLKAVVVYNNITKGQLEGFHDNVHVVPGGVDVANFDYTPPPQRALGERKIILMSGRANDPSKGIDVLIEAGRRLAAKRRDFEIRVTDTDYTRNGEWLQCVGWHDFRSMMRLYRESDICVVPSTWEEPFGLVAVEAMATGRPVCVGRVGGLQEIVVHGETGYVYDRFDAGALAEHLERLLDDADLRRNMGAAGRQRVEDQYDWKRVIERHYPPLLEGLAT